MRSRTHGPPPNLSNFVRCFSLMRTDTITVGDDASSGARPPRLGFGLKGAMAVGVAGEIEGPLRFEAADDLFIHDDALQIGERTAGPPIGTDGVDLSDAPGQFGHGEIDLPLQQGGGGDR